MSEQPTPIEVVLRAVKRGEIEVRDDGSVWKLMRWGKPCEPVRFAATTRAGYLIVPVWEGGRQFFAYAHRLVWTVLRGPIPVGMEINHIDGCKANNTPDNLEVVTQSENALHAYRIGLKVRPPSMPDPLPASRIEKARQLRAEGNTFAEAGRRAGISQTSAFRAAKGLI